MIKILASCLLVTIAATSVHGIRLQLPSFVFGLMKVGLDMDDTEPSTLYDQVCSNLSLWRGLKYTDNEQNVLDVATSPGTSSAPRPVLLFVAGESFANEGTSVDWEMRQKAICLSARNGMVGVSMSYRRAPAHHWPAGAQDVAAATSWVRENIDLFGGDPHAIVVIGYSVGAFHVATFLAHRELQVTDSHIAGAVLLSASIVRRRTLIGVSEPISARIRPCIKPDRRSPASSRSRSPSCSRGQPSTPQVWSPKPRIWTRASAAQDIARALPSSPVAIVQPRYSGSMPPTKLWPAKCGN